MTGPWNDFNSAQSNTNVIPKGTIAKVRLTLRPGGFDDASQGWTGGWARRATTGAVYLDAEYTVLEGPYARRKIWSLIGLYSPKGPDWANMGRGLVRDDVLRELIYTNREFTGAEAQTLGLATYCDENPRERAFAIARQIAGKNPHAIRAAKRLQAGMWERETDAILLEESIEQHAIMRSRNQVEAVMAEMERRKPNFEDV